MVFLQKNPDSAKRNPKKRLESQLRAYAKSAKVIKKLVPVIESSSKMGHRKRFKVEKPED